MFDLTVKAFPQPGTLQTNATAYRNQTSAVLIKTRSYVVLLYGSVYVSKEAINFELTKEEL